MAIRLRSVDGETVALCAAETLAIEGDIYLDDNAHYALMLKFARELCPEKRICEPRNDMLAESQRDTSACAERDA